MNFGGFSSRLSGVALDSAYESPEGQVISDEDRVTSVELCQCPVGYHGYSCESCAIGYYRGQEGPLGPICVPCNCNSHANICHPTTGKCIALKPMALMDPEHIGQTHVPPSGLGAPPKGDGTEAGSPGPLEGGPPSREQIFCHFRPDLCEENTEVEASEILLYLLTTLTTRYLTKNPKKFFGLYNGPPRPARTTRLGPSVNIALKASTETPPWEPLKTANPALVPSGRTSEKLFFFSYFFGPFIIASINYLRFEYFEELSVRSDIFMPDPKIIDESVYNFYT